LVEQSRAEKKGRKKKGKRNCLTVRIGSGSRRLARGSFGAKVPLIVEHPKFTGWLRQREEERKRKSSKFLKIKRDS